MAIYYDSKLYAKQPFLGNCLTIQLVMKSERKYKIEALRKRTMKLREIFLNIVT